MKCCDLKISMFITLSGNVLQTGALFTARQSFRTAVPTLTVTPNHNPTLTPTHPTNPNDPNPNPYPKQHSPYTVGLSLD